MILRHHPAELTEVLLFEHLHGGTLLLKRHMGESIETIVDVPYGRLSNETCGASGRL
jgi:hypothetical protein